MSSEAEMIAEVRQLTSTILTNLGQLSLSNGVVMSSLFSALLMICANAIEDGNTSVRGPMREMAARLLVVAESTPEMVDHTMAMVSDHSASLKTKQ